MAFSPQLPQNPSHAQKPKQNNNLELNLPHIIAFLTKGLQNALWKPLKDSLKNKVVSEPFGELKGSRALIKSSLDLKRTSSRIFPRIAPYS